MRPFKNHGKYWLRVPTAKGPSVRISTGTADGPQARQIAALVERLAARHEYDLLKLVTSRDLSLGMLWQAFQNDPTLRAFRATLSDPDIEPLVDTWHTAALATGTRGASKYLAQVRVLIPAGVRFPRSDFRRSKIAAFLAGLDATGSTKNRYHAALASFARWLVEAELLEHNPVYDVRRSKENPARATIYTPAEVQALVKALAGPHRAIAALMAGTGMEWQAIRRLHRRDIDWPQFRVHAHGSKTASRDRDVSVTEEWARPMIGDYIAPFLPGALLFDGVRYEDFLAAHHAAVKALKLDASRPHDHRHHYAVALRRRGVADTVIARQLGHASTLLVQQRYGRYQPTVEEIEQATARTPALTATQ